MINATELRLGNWVYDGECTQFPMWVQAIGEDYVYLNFEGNEAGPWESTPDELQGVPVTADLLKKIGFEEKKGVCPQTFYRYWDKDDKYKLDVDPEYCNSDSKWSMHVDNGDCSTIGSGEFTYVHELQNLVSAITKEELKIVL